jgi:hypothetical protein
MSNTSFYGFDHEILLLQCNASVLAPWMLVESKTLAAGLASYSLQQQC